MNKILKTIMASLVALVVAGSAVAQSAPQTSPAMESTAAVDMQQVCPHHGMPTAEFASVKCCYVPALGGAFVLIDSIDCAIDLLLRQGDTLVRAGRYVTDNIFKRHDLPNILRPVSVQVVNGKIFFLASSAKDSAYLGVLSMTPDAEGNLNLEQRVGFHSSVYAFQIDPMNQEILVAGKNQVGYDFIILNLDENVENINVKGTPFHYHVPKQSEKIQASDPVGIGLTVVAVSVVFLALICIFLIIQGEGKAIRRVQRKRAAKAAAAVAAKSGKAVDTIVSVDTAGEVYAAISAAIYLYDEEMHDDEDTVITIQKVERAWTPWNAKYYNMNHYFNNNKR